MKRFSSITAHATATVFVLVMITSGLAAQALQRLETRVTRHTLKNGLNVLLMERHANPTIAFHIYYDVGSVDEEIGKTGLAHLFEHMAFKGTPTLGTRDYAKEKLLFPQIDELEARLTAARDRNEDAAKIKDISDELEKVQKEADAFVVSNEVGQLYEKNGGTGLNANTGRDATEYYVSFPANKSELWAAVESDRMTHTIFRQFYKERDVVMEERRRSVDTNPIGKLFEKFLVNSFEAHPYGLHAGWGWPSDLLHLTRQDGEEFFRKYYAPSNTTIAIVGDFSTTEMIRLVDHYFGSIPSSPKPPRIHTLELPQQGERRVEVEFDTNPYLFLGWHRPDARDKDDVVLDVIQDLLSSGRTSRLYRSLVLEKKIAAAAQALSSTPLIYGKYPTLFLIVGVPLAGHTTGEVEEGIDQELDKLKTTLVTPRELQKVVNQIDAQLIRNLRSNSGMASLLAQTEVINGDWKQMIAYRENLQKVSPTDVQRVARDIFKKGNRTVAYHVPVRSERTTDGPAAPIAPTSAESVARAKQIVAEVTKTKGGLEALKAVKDIVTKATAKLTSPMGDQEVTVTGRAIYPSKLRVEITVPQGTVTQATNGTLGWIQFGPNTQEMPPATLASLKDALKRDSIQIIILLNDPNTKLQTQDDEPVDGKPADVVLATDADGQQTKLCFDKTTHFLLKMSYSIKTPFGADVAAEDLFSDYRAVNGIQIPFQHVQNQNGKKLSESRTTSLEINAGVDPKIFEKP
ncbi:MAG: insulinase family protein [Acidobacteriia bacterium]|nr:insulinase family protein [Terriglobia bacterium]